MRKREVKATDSIGIARSICQDIGGFKLFLTLIIRTLNRIYTSRGSRIPLKSSPQERKRVKGDKCGEGFWFTIGVRPIQVGTVWGLLVALHSERPFEVRSNARQQPRSNPRRC